MDREEANLEEQSWLEEFLGEDWKQQLEITITSSSASLKRRPFAPLPCKALSSAQRSCQRDFCNGEGTEECPSRCLLHLSLLVRAVDPKVIHQPG